MNALAPSILTADFGDLKNTLIQMDEGGAQYVHLDVMDGHFVPNISIGIPVVRSVRAVTDRILDLHLMVQEPDLLIPEFAKAGADIITVHAEACTHLDRTISLIKEQGVMASVALNPSTPLSALEYIIENTDMILIMTVNPGFGGQSFIPYTLRKIRDLKEMIEERDLSVDIEVDGGIKLSNVHEVMDAGANIIVAGSAVFDGDIKENISAFLKIMEQNK